MDNQAVISTHVTCCETGAVLKTIMILKYLHGKMQDPMEMWWVTDSLKDEKFKENCALMAVPVTKYLP